MGYRRMIACVASLTIGFSPIVCLGGVLFESFNPNLVTGLTLAPNISMLPSGGNFDMHAGALVRRSGPPDTQVFHVPAQPRAITNPPFFPTTTTAMMPGIEITKNLMKNRQQNVTIKGGAVLPKKPPVPYTQTPKDFTRTIPISTNTAFRLGTDPNGMTSTAEALAKVTFSTLNILGFQFGLVNPNGSFSEYVRNGTLRTGLGPNGAAGTLLRDPITYSDVPAGATVSEVFNLNFSDFRVQVDDSTGLAAADIQLGTNAFGSAPGSLGLDAEGNPLLMEVDIDFMPSGNIFLQFQQDSSLGTQTFFDPTTGASITGNVDDFIADQLISALVFDPATTTWTLSGNVSLLGDEFDVPSAITTLNVDYILSQEVVDASEPSTLALLPGCLLLLRVYFGRRALHNALIGSRL